MDDLERAETFKRLFVDPAVDAMCEKMEAHLAPIVKQLETQADKDLEQDARLAGLESKQFKALAGWGFFATALSVVIGAGWGWIKGRVFK